MNNPATIKFARVKAGYIPITKGKPLFGNLLLDGNIIHEKKPFALLRYEMNKLKREGIVGRRLKITY